MGSLLTQVKSLLSREASGDYPDSRLQDALCTIDGVLLLRIHTKDVPEDMLSQSERARTGLKPNDKLEVPVNLHPLVAHDYIGKSEMSVSNAFGFKMALPSEPISAIHRVKTWSDRAQPDSYEDQSTMMVLHEVFGDETEPVKETNNGEPRSSNDVGDVTLSSDVVGPLPKPSNDVRAELRALDRTLLPPGNRRSLLLVLPQTPPQVLDENRGLDCQEKKGMPEDLSPTTGIVESRSLKGSDPFAPDSAKADVWNHPFGLPTQYDFAEVVDKGNDEGLTWNDSEVSVPYTPTNAGTRAVSSLVSTAGTTAAPSLGFIAEVIHHDPVPSGSVLGYVTGGNQRGNNGLTDEDTASPTNILQHKHLNEVEKGDLVSEAPHNGEEGMADSLKDALVIGLAGKSWRFPRLLRPSRLPGSSLAPGPSIPPRPPRPPRPAPFLTPFMPPYGPSSFARVPRRKPVPAPMSQATDPQMMKTKDIAFNGSEEPPTDVSATTTKRGGILLERDNPVARELRPLAGEEALPPTRIPTPGGLQSGRQYSSGNIVAGKREQPTVELQPDVPVLRDWPYEEDPNEWKQILPDWDWKPPSSNSDDCAAVSRYSRSEPASPEESFLWEARLGPPCARAVLPPELQEKCKGSALTHENLQKLNGDAEVKSQLTRSHALADIAAEANGNRDSEVLIQLQANHINAVIRSAQAYFAAQAESAQAAPAEIKYSKTLTEVTKPKIPPVDVLHSKTLPEISHQKTSDSVEGFQTVRTADRVVKDAQGLSTSEIASPAAPATPAEIPRPKTPTEIKRPKTPVNMAKTDGEVSRPKTPVSANDAAGLNTTGKMRKVSEDMPRPSTSHSTRSRAPSVVPFPPYRDYKRVADAAVAALKLRAPSSKPSEQRPVTPVQEDKKDALNEDNSELRELKGGKSLKMFSKNRRELSTPPPPPVPEVPKDRYAGSYFDFDSPSPKRTRKRHMLRKFSGSKAMDEETSANKEGRRMRSGSPFRRQSEDKSFTDSEAPPRIPPLPKDVSSKETEFQGSWGRSLGNRFLMRGRRETSSRRPQLPDLTEEQRIEEHDPELENIRKKNDTYRRHYNLKPENYAGDDLYIPIARGSSSSHGSSQYAPGHGSHGSNGSVVYAPDHGGSVGSRESGDLKTQQGKRGAQKSSSGDN